MTADVAMFDADEISVPERYDLSRFGARWRLVGFGLFNVWKYDFLDLTAPSGRLLLRGPNGTGKTTALEALWPYLMDLERAPSKLAAGKSRNTSLPSLMKEGGSGKRIGYAWASFADPQGGVVSYGVRLILTSGDKVSVEPFWIPGRPMADMSLTDAGESSITASETFARHVESHGGQVFDAEDDYVADIAARIFGARSNEVRALADRIRQARRPDLKDAETPDRAAALLREALPGVSEQVVAETANALDANDETREAFERDEAAAGQLEDFAGTWTAYAAGVARTAATNAGSARSAYIDAQANAQTARDQVAGAEEDEALASGHVAELEADERATRSAIEGLKAAPEYKEIGHLEDLQAAVRSTREAADARMATLRHLADTAKETAERHSETARRLRSAVAMAHQEASGADPLAGTAPASIVINEPGPWPTIRIGEQIFDPGQLITIPGDAAEGIAVASAAWRKLSTEHATRAAEAKNLVEKYRHVEKAEGEAAEAARRAAAAQFKASEASQDRDRDAHAARTAAARLAEQVLSWGQANTDLAQTIDDPGDETLSTSIKDHEGVREVATDHRLLLSTAEQWRQDARTTAERLAAAAEQEVKTLQAEATQLDQEAADLEAEVMDLRGGRVLDPPRPEWATSAGTAFSNVLTWAEGVEEGTQAIVEAAMSASGLLGAAIGEDGVDAGAWRVSVHGKPTSGAVSTVVIADPEHELAAVAQRVLDRIAFAPTVTETNTSAQAAIGSDGSFRVGVLAGRAPGAAEPASLPTTQYIGASQRRAAALARATELESTARALRARAERDRTLAQDRVGTASKTRSRAKTFPNLASLSAAARKLDLAEKMALEYEKEAIDADSDRENKAEAARAALARWREQVQAAGLTAELAVMSREVGQSADWWLVADCAVESVVVVGV